MAFTTGQSVQAVDGIGRWEAAKVKKTFYPLEGTLSIFVDGVRTLTDVYYMEVKFGFPFLQLTTNNV